jgi:DNA-binding GntR family transcriptional regulator
MTVVAPWEDEPVGGSLAERAYYLIRDRILTLVIAPGAAIHEERLCADLGLGRTPVREAIKRLESERLVVIYPRRGTFATEINTTDHALIADVRRQLEAHAAGRAAERANRADGEVLGRLRAGMAGLGREDLSELMRLDAAIHRAIYRASHNPYLEATLGQYYNLSLRLWYVFIDRVEDVGGHVAGHAPLIDAILGGDAAEASRLAAAHVDGFEVAVVESERAGFGDASRAPG